MGRVATTAAARLEEAATGERRSRLPARPTRSKKQQRGEVSVGRPRAECRGAGAGRVGRLERKAELDPPSAVDAQEQELGSASTGGTTQQRRRVKGKVKKKVKVVLAQPFFDLHGPDAFSVLWYLVSGVWYNDRTNLSEWSVWSTRGDDAQEGAQHKANSNKREKAKVVRFKGKPDLPPVSS